MHYHWDLAMVLADTDRWWHGIGITLGLYLFWGLEVVRNNFFRLLDRMNIKPHVRKASAAAIASYSGKVIVLMRA